MERCRRVRPSQGELLLRAALERVRAVTDALGDTGTSRERVADLLVEAEVQIVMALDWQMLRDQRADPTAGLVLSKKDLEMLKAPLDGPAPEEKGREEDEERGA